VRRRTHVVAQRLVRRAGNPERNGCGERLDEDELARFNLGRQGDASIISEAVLCRTILRFGKLEGSKQQIACGAIRGVLSPLVGLKGLWMVLEIDNSHNVIARLDEDEKDVDIIDTPGG